MDASERLAAIGALVVCLSLSLPWYGIPRDLENIGGLARTGFGSFSFVEAALLLTAGAALALIYARGLGKDVPLPVREGSLLLAAGAWAALLVAYRMLDRPHYISGGFDVAYDIRFGLFVALGGAVTIIVAGLRRRQVERVTGPG